MSRKKNRRWKSTRSTGQVDATVQARFEAAFEQQLDAEMKRQVALAMPRGNMAGVRLTVKTPVRDLVFEFPGEDES